MTDQLILKTLPKCDTFSTDVAIESLNAMYGTDMHAIMCFLNNFLQTKSSSRTDLGIYILDKDPDMKLVAQGKHGKVYTSKMTDKEIDVYIKVPKDQFITNELIREYFIGIQAMNSLRYKIPTFVYTLGAFQTNRFNLILESIPGKTLQQHLKENTITWEEYLEVFIQIIISLDIAQQEHQFTHFDLHCDNVILRRVDNLKYSVPYGCSSWDITARKWCPVILDYGLSTIGVDHKSIGTTHFKEYGMMNYMVPGYDIYKFLLYSVDYSVTNKPLQRSIMKLFEYYKNIDTIFTEGPSGVKKRLQTFGKEGTFSHIAKYNPALFLKWLSSNKVYNKIISKTLSTVTRHSLITLPPRIISSRSLDCIKLSPSYINNIYISKLNKAEHINSMIIEANKHDMIKYDKSLLQGFKDILLTNENILSKALNEVLRVNINDDNKMKEKNATHFLKLTLSYSKLEPYCNMLYMIRELKLNSIYESFISAFEKSIQYNTYCRNQLSLSIGKRWSKTLLLSIYN